MTTAQRSRLAFLCFVLAGVASFFPREASAQPAHLQWAEELVDNLALEDNEYDANPSFITWAGVNGATRYASRSYCNSFVTNLLMQAYGWTDDSIKAWFGVRGPNAGVYTATIDAEKGFSRIETLDQILPGDIMAISYPDGSSSSGHVVVVRSAPTYRAATAPIVAGTLQFAIDVVDSTRSPHGTVDTRIETDGTQHPGAGFGIMRLYTDNALNIVGHAWSPASGAPYRAEPTYHVAIGRLR